MTKVFSFSGKLFFASCRDTNEFWVPIVEKGLSQFSTPFNI
jgi:hypothetical protein